MVGMPKTDILPLPWARPAETRFDAKSETSMPDGECLAMINQVVATWISFK